MTSPAHCGDDGLCCVPSGFSSFCLPGAAGDCGTSAMACDSVADCPENGGSPATGCAPSTDGAPVHDVCVY